jgi:hypothetical protein
MVVVTARQATQPGGIGSLESILGLLESLTIRILGSAHVLKVIVDREPETNASAKLAS